MGSQGPQIFLRDKITVHQNHRPRPKIPGQPLQPRQFLQHMTIIRPQHPGLIAFLPGQRPGSFIRAPENHMLRASRLLRDSEAAHQMTHANIRVTVRPNHKIRLIPCLHDLLPPGFQTQSPTKSQDMGVPSPASRVILLPRSCS